MWFVDVTGVGRVTSHFVDQLVFCGGYLLAPSAAGTTVMHHVSRHDKGRQGAKTSSWRAGNCRAN
jgi:hypothetical protein